MLPAAVRWRHRDVSEPFWSYDARISAAQLGMCCRQPDPEASSGPDQRASGSRDNVRQPRHLKSIPGRAATSRRFSRQSKPRNDVRLNSPSGCQGRPGITWNSWSPWRSYSATLRPLNGTSVPSSAHRRIPYRKVGSIFPLCLKTGPFPPLRGGTAPFCNNLSGKCLNRTASRRSAGRYANSQAAGLRRPGRATRAPSSGCVRVEHLGLRRGFPSTYPSLPAAFAIQFLLR